MIQELKDILNIAPQPEAPIDIPGYNTYKYISLTQKPLGKQKPVECFIKASFQGKLIFLIFC